MSDAPETTQRHARVLAELAELGMAIARDVQAEVLSAETPEEKARAAAVFPQVARAVRQTVALEAKLLRDLARHEREDRQDADREIARRIRQRKARVRLHMERAICEASAPDYDEDGPPEVVTMRLEDLRDRLDDDVLDADFAFRPFHEVIEALHRSLGLPPPMDLPAEEDEDDPDGDDPDDDDPEARAEHEPEVPELDPAPPLPRTWPDANPWRRSG